MHMLYFTLYLLYYTYNIYSGERAKEGLDTISVTGKQHLLSILYYIHKYNITHILYTQNIPYITHTILYTLHCI